MKNTKIVLVAAWDGWCASCAVERPLVLTRIGRLGLRTWLTAPVVESRPLTLTCRLCGFSEVVPPEADDPPVPVTDQDAAPAPAALPAAGPVPDGGSPTPPAAPLLAAPASPVVDHPVAVAPVSVPALGAAPVVPVPAPAPAPVDVRPVALAPVALAPVAAAPAALAHRDPELDRVRGALGAALGALLATRTAQASNARPVPAVAPPLVAGAAPALPLQRTTSPDTDGLATLQLLADGLDLLSSSRP